MAHETLKRCWCRGPDQCVGRSGQQSTSEEISPESPRKMQDEQEATSEASWNAKGGKEEDGWRLETEGETETPETKVLRNEVEGVPVNPDGEGRHEQVQAKSSRRESEAPGEEGEEVKSPKRKVIRVESEETQDYVRETKGLSKEEAEEISFVPNAISVPQKPLFRCDNRHSQKTLSFWQFASVVIKEDEESYTTNVCQKCYNKSLVERGGKPLTKVAVVRVCGDKGASWKVMENVGKRPEHTRDVGILVAAKRFRVKKFREGCPERKGKGGIQGQ